MRGRQTAGDGRYLSLAKIPSDVRHSIWVRRLLLTPSSHLISEQLRVDVIGDLAASEYTIAASPGEIQAATPRVGSDDAGHRPVGVRSPLQALLIVR